MSDKPGEKIAGVQYFELSLYPGPMSACANCGRAFTPGDVLVKSEYNILVFCYSAAGRVCQGSFAEFVLTSLIPPSIEPMVYLKHTDPFVCELPVASETLRERITRLLWGW